MNDNPLTVLPVESLDELKPGDKVLIALTVIEPGTRHHGLFATYREDGVIHAGSDSPRLSIYVRATDIVGVIPENKTTQQP